MDSENKKKQATFNVVFRAISLRFTNMRANKNKLHCFSDKCQEGEKQPPFLSKGVNRQADYAAKSRLIIFNW